MKILILNHFFDQDIEAIQQANKLRKHDIQVLPYERIFDEVCKILPENAKSDTTYNSADLSEIKPQLRETVNNLIKKIRKKFQFDIFVTPSDLFYWLREFIFMLKEMGIKVVVIDKEGMISPHFFVETEIIKEKCPFISDYIAVWSERQKVFWKACGAQEDKIIVTGQPRSDILFQNNRWKNRKQLNKKLSNDRKIVLFFSYDSWAYIPWDDYASGKISWKELLQQTFNVIIEFAKNNPNTDIIVKMHPQQYGDDKKNIEEICKKANLRNVYLMAGSATGYDLILNSDVIVGFQTTAIAEAMMTDKPVIYTFWTKACRDFEQGLIPYKKSNALLVADSPESLKEFIEQSLKYPEVNEQMKSSREKFVEEYFYKVDGNSSLRVLEFLEKLMNKGE